MSEDERTAEQIRFSLDRTLLFVFDASRAACERLGEPDEVGFLQGLVRSDIERLVERTR